MQIRSQRYSTRKVVSSSVLELPDGENTKPRNVQYGFELLLEHNHSRDVVIIALGGGVIMTLLVCCVLLPAWCRFYSDTDDFLSGLFCWVETAVNHPLGKNMIGAFYQPKAVIIDTNCLATLPEREFAAGMAEVIKYGIIYDRSFFRLVRTTYG